jgi:hypothetical protein
MWHTDTLWFEVAVVSSLLAIRGVLFGRFEEHKPRWLQLLIGLSLVCVIVAVSAIAGRIWALATLGLAIAFGTYMHAWWLPRRGVNGWTGEPRQRYLELMSRRRAK